MGEMVAEDAQTFVPILIIIVIAMNFFDLFGKAMRLLGLRDDFLNEDDENSWGDADDGRVFLAEGKTF